MLGRLFKARLKAAETALADGRVDEAFRLATVPDLAGERRAQKVLGDAGEKLFARAEAHYKAGRCAEALLDLDKAERAGFKLSSVSDLRTIVRAAVDEQSRNQQSRRGRIDAAQQRLAAGSLRAAEQILERASAGDAQAGKLKQQAADREERAEELFKEVKQYVKDNHLARAIERFKDARRLHSKNKQVPEWERVLVEKVIDSVNQSLTQGRLNRAFEEMNLLSGVGAQSPAKAELAAALDTISAAGAAVASGDYEGARRKVLGLEHLLPSAKWVRQAAGQLKQVDELVTHLHGGPLGLVPKATAEGRGSGAIASRRAGKARGSLSLVVDASARLDETMAMPGQLLGDSLLPERLLILVDGSGSYLLIRNPRASIGRAATDHPADIPIVSNLSERHADIARVDDDYFLFANREVYIGGKPVQQKLLQSGDKIILGKRSKLTFNLPSRKSTSAVLDLSGSGKLPNDVKRVILFDRLATVGRKSNAHIVVTTASEDLVLYERGGKLWLRHKVNGRGDDGVPIELDVPFEYAGVSMVVEPWKIKV
ncbi:MAG: FHA domain-containing protein [Planctomycetes bacterium]|nr:FHA domain-containing protein [Planctomycetota bacterium]